MIDFKDTKLITPFPVNYGELVEQIMDHAETEVLSGEKQSSTLSFSGIDMLCICSLRESR